MSQNFTQYAQNLQFLNHAYQCLKINNKSFDCVNITRKITSAHTEEKKSGNKDDKKIMVIETQV